MPIGCPKRANANTTGTAVRRFSSRNLPKEYPMARTIQCTYLKKEAQGLDFAPYPGELGKRIYNERSKEAWQAWMKHQTMLANENRLNLAAPGARQYLARKKERCYFGESVEQPEG